MFFYKSRVFLKFFALNLVFRPVVFRPVVVNDTINVSGFFILDVLRGKTGVGKFG